MSSAAEYWAERNRMVLTQGLEKADAVARELEKSYRRAQREVQAAVDKICATFAGESGLSYADAQAYLTKGELKEWRYTLEEYVERINASGDKDLLRELNALSARSRIRRLQQVQTAIDVAASELASRGEALTRDLLEDAYGGAYVQVGGALQAGLGVGGRLEMLNRTEVAQAAAYPWSGASFSERIWNNADSLARALRQAVTQGLIQGQDARQMGAAIAKATGSSAADAERLIRTETARCIEEATLKGYAAAGVGRYQILVDEDERTCKFCGAIDEEAVHEVAGAVTGVNLPPFHPRCRCTTVPYFSQEELDRWEALGAAANGEEVTPDTEEDTDAEITPDVTWFRATYGETVAKGMQALLRAADEDVVRAWNSVSADFRTKSSGYAGSQAYYSPMDDAVTINMRSSVAGNNYQKPHQLAFHEFGHMEDYLLNRKFGDGDRLRALSESFQGRNSDGTVQLGARGTLGLLGRTAKEEAAEAVKRAKKKYGVKTKKEAVQHWLQEIAQGKSLYAKADVSDILEGAGCGISYPLGVGHGTSYWKGRDNGKEIFAEITSAEIANAESLELIKQTFPRTYAVYREILKVVKGNA